LGRGWAITENHDPVVGEGSQHGGSEAPQGFMEKSLGKGRKGLWGGLKEAFSKEVQGFVCPSFTVGERVELFFNFS
jgi:hypothetical protein